MIPAKALFYFKVMYLLVMGRLVSASAIRKDYDRLSRTYDSYFTKRIAEHSRQLITEMAVQRGGRALDLACGTGTLTLAMAESVGRTGEVIGVDRSPGMLSVADAKRTGRGLRSVRLIESDMRDGLDMFPDNTFDAITCGWAIGYVDPRALLEAISRKLKPGGKVGLIENMRGTLSPIRETCVKVAQAFPQHLEQVMDLHLRLPKGRRHLDCLFKAAGLRSMGIWEGREEFEFHSGADVLDWVLHTGASAGFDAMMAPGVKERCDALFVRTVEKDFMKDGRISVAHCYVAGIAERGE